MINGSVAATVEHDGIAYDLYEDDGRLWSVALVDSSVDLIDVLKREVLRELEDMLHAAQSAEFAQSVNESLEDRAESIAAYH